LTPRESEVLVKIVDGLDNKAIGQALYIAEDTVKTHVKSILRKLGARDRGQAISIAYKEGLIG
jgi:DNA-binding NarL/FixJ family response regulator